MCGGLYTGAGCIKMQLKLTIVKCECQPIRIAYSRVNYILTTKSQLKSFIQPALDSYYLEYYFSVFMIKVNGVDYLVATVGMCHIITANLYFVGVESLHS